MTLKEMIEYRQIWNRLKPNAHSDSRYICLQQLAYTYHGNDNTMNNYVYYKCICKMVDNNINENEILSMTKEQIFTYCYLFDLKLKV